MTRFRSFNAFCFVIALCMPIIALASPTRGSQGNTTNVSAQVGLGYAIENGHLIITALKPGCPAFEQKQLHIGDEIVQIKSNGASAWVTVKGLSLEEINKLVNGEVGKLLHLQIKQQGHEWVVILRRKENC